MFAFACVYRLTPCKNNLYRRSKYCRSSAPAHDMLYDGKLYSVIFTVYVFKLRIIIIQLCDSLLLYSLEVFTREHSIIHNRPLIIMLKVRYSYRIAIFVWWKFSYISYTEEHRMKINRSKYNYALVRMRKRGTR